MWFLTTGPRVTTPKSLAEIQAKDTPVYLEEALPSPTVGFIDILTVSNSALSKSVLPCAYSLKNLPQTLFPLMLLWMQPAKSTPRWRIECSFVCLSELVDILGKFPRISACASLLSHRLTWGSVLKPHSVVTTKMKNFDLYFSKRRNFFSRLFA